MQLEIKEQRLLDIKVELQKLTEELLSERGRFKGVEQMLVHERLRADQARSDLNDLKDQLSDNKAKLGKALITNAEFSVTVRSATETGLCCCSALNAREAKRLLRCWNRACGMV
jgi:chromosome segregation ATPase